MANKKRIIDDNKINESIEKAVNKLENFLKDLFLGADENLKKQIYNMSRWVCSWIEYLRYEKSFKPETLKRFDKGNVVLINFGYNIGSELGGIHFAIVINKEDSIKKPNIVIIPLTSLKDKSVLTKLGDRVYLGNEIKDLVESKFTDKVLNIKEKIENIKNIDKTDKSYTEMLKNINKKTEYAIKLEELKDMLKEDSLAHPGQIKAISKMRILNPKNSHDSLFNISISKETMKKIDDKIKQLYCK